ncbi:MAG: Tfp pilus biogenesis protein PilC [Candidatus Roizmanbacteria bacterium GW2011_GWA2_37_7]|uniref:Tfp pilus biogenesis protein PilC n=1 Tax=Candidatus Roizmanbacteria bacterium GW2011_GWA2_37_7 TaxID=1618481 RepID=A0A0G0H9F2_9BACT|nr:MAG: Tfp pilus biogenesis protein PilC [Candidatus Roizmanbacteria bacterium GW2011_GWA2_37_7]
MLYQYKALKNNQKVNGEMEASSEKEIADYLKSNGYFPIDIIEKKKSKLTDFMAIFQQVAFQDIVYMTRQFAIMLNAGLTLIDSIDIIKKQVSKAPFKKMLDELDRQLRDGKTFSTALTRYPGQFSHFYVALVKSGEASGKLDNILQKLAEHLDKQRTFKQTVRNALIYPVVIITAMFSMIFVMFTFVMPKLLSLYDSFQVELPQSTKTIMQISNFMEANWIWVLIGIIAAIIGIIRFLKTKQGKNMFDKYILKIPVLGNIVRTSGLVDATRTLSILISSGVPILDGLVIVTDVNPNMMFRQAFARISQKVEKGLSVGTAMSNEPIFPESLTQMTIVGEQTGHLDETLMKLAEYYQSESEMAVKGMLSLLEPMIIVVLGISVGFLVMSIITPIFTLTNSMQ